mmetsp:Transcript_7954/g.29658  ORF Transcript_7954/g.29658 Transcript_7954/m.29658 type:complete len:106 (-) Transcript_7954:364-681(-)
MLPWNQLQRMFSKNFEQQLQTFMTQKLLNSASFRFFAQKTHRTIQDVKENPEQVFNQAQRQMNNQKNFQQETTQKQKSIFSVIREEVAKELSELNPLSKKPKDKL